MNSSKDRPLHTCTSEHLPTATVRMVTKPGMPHCNAFATLKENGPLTQLFWCRRPAEAQVQVKTQARQAGQTWQTSGGTTKHTARPAPVACTRRPGACAGPGPASHRRRPAADALHLLRSDLEQPREHGEHGAVARQRAALKAAEDDAAQVSHVSVAQLCQGLGLGFGVQGWGEGQVRGAARKGGEGKVGRMGKTGER